MNAIVRKIFAGIRGVVGSAFAGLGVNGTIIALALAGAALAFALFVRAERAAGARAVLVQIYADSVHRSARRADSLARIYRVDTVTLHRLDRVYDTVYLRADLSRVIDSVRVAHPARPDTVRVAVPVRVLVAADSDIRACRITVADCETHAEALAAQLAAARAELAALSSAGSGPGLGVCMLGGAGVGGLLFAGLKLFGR